MPRSVSPGVRLPPFQRLIDDHAAELHRFLVASVGPADAEDCLQETLLSALRAYPRLRHADNLRAWLYVIAQRKATDTVRDRQRHRAGELDAVAEGRLASDPHRSFDDGVWTSVRALPAKQRAAVLMHKYEGLGYVEIAQALRCSESAVKSVLFRAYETLRTRLAHMA